MEVRTWRDTLVALGVSVRGVSSWPVTPSSPMNAKVLVVPLVALVATAGYFFWRGDVEPTPMAPVAHTAGAPAAPSKADLLNAALPLTPPPTPAAGAGTSDRTAVPVADDRKTVAAVITLRGRLVDAKGTPRPAVVLAMRSWTAPDGTTIVELPPRPLPDRAREDQPTWTTRSDGTFAIPLAAGHAASLELQSDDLVFAKNEPTVEDKKVDQDLGDITVLRAGTVQGVVKDERGQPVAGVKVAVTLGSLGFGGFGASSASVSKADGAFTVGKLRPGKWSLRTASGKFLPTVEALTLEAEEQRMDVVLVVRAGNAIAGQVVDDRGMGVAAMKVGSKRKEASGAIDIERFTADEATTTDANGYFTLAGLSDEFTSVRAFGPGHSAVTQSDVQVGTGNLLLRVERLGIVEGVLQAADGAPIAGSRVRSEATGAQGEGMLMLESMDLPGPGGRESAVTAADGSFRLASVRPGAATIVASGKTHRPARSATINVLPAQVTKGVRLIADLGATAVVKVVDEAGKPVAGADVQADRASEPQATNGPGGTFRARTVQAEDHGGGMVIGGNGPLGTAKTDAEGVAKIHGLPAAQLAFTAKHENFAPASAVMVTTPKVGSVEAALTLRKPGHAEIVVLGMDGAGLSGIEVQVRERDNDKSQIAKSGEQGLARVGPLAPGNYTATLTRPRSGGSFGGAMVFLGDGQDTIASSAQQFVVVAGETTRVELRRPVLTKLHGVVTGADGPALGCVIQLASAADSDLELPGFGGRSATAAADGAFAFEDVEAGQYELRYGKPTQVVKARAQVEVPANTPELRHDLVLRTGKVRVQVVAAGSNDGIEKAEVELVRADAEPTAGAPARPRERRVMMVSMMTTNDGEDGAESTTMTVGAQRALTDEDGIAEIEDVPVGDYTVRIKHKRHAPVELKGKSVVERQLTDCGRVELAAAGQIRGKVLAADGKAARMALVQSRLVGTESWGEPEMAQGGSFRLSGLAAGRYEVRAQSLGQETSTYSPAVAVDVKSGEIATADLQLPPN